jgi:hypothetical protein
MLLQCDARSTVVTGRSGSWLVDCTCEQDGVWTNAAAASKQPAAANAALRIDVRTPAKSFIHCYYSRKNSMKAHLQSLLPTESVVSFRPSTLITNLSLTI